MTLDIKEDKNKEKYVVLSTGRDAFSHFNKFKEYSLWTLVNNLTILILKGGWTYEELVSHNVHLGKVLIKEEDYIKYEKSVIGELKDNLEETIESYDNCHNEIETIKKEKEVNEKKAEKSRLKYTSQRLKNALEVQKAEKKEVVVKTKKLLQKMWDLVYSHKNAELVRHVGNSVGVLVDNFYEHPKRLENMLFIPKKDYDLAINSVNIMVYTLAYCLLSKSYFIKEDPKENSEDIKKYCIGSLFMDIGYSELQRKIISQDKILTEQEKQELNESHSLSGAELMKDAYNDDSIIYNGILGHHKKLNPDDYITGEYKGEVSYSGQLYRLITAFVGAISDRPYKGFKQRKEALAHIKDEVIKKEKNPEIYKDFVSVISELKINET